MVAFTAQPGLLAVKVYTPALPLAIPVTLVLKDPEPVMVGLPGPVHKYVLAATPVLPPVSVSVPPAHTGLGDAEAVTPEGY